MTNPTSPRAGMTPEERAELVESAQPPSVTLAQIREQRSKGWPDFDPEDYCHRCGGRNPSSWFVDSDRFNTAFGPPMNHPYNGIVCPGCFVEAHEAATGLTVSWHLVPGGNFVHIDDLPSESQ